MSDKNEIPGAEDLQKELSSGIEALKKLVTREASKTMVTFQTKVIEGTLDDLIKVICGEDLEKEEDKE